MPFRCKLYARGAKAVRNFSPLTDYSTSRPLFQATFITNFEQTPFCLPFPRVPRKNLPCSKSASTYIARCLAPVIPASRFTRRVPCCNGRVCSQPTVRSSSQNHSKRRSLFDAFKGLIDFAHRKRLDLWNDLVPRTKFEHRSRRPNTSRRR